MIEEIFNRRSIRKFHTKLLTREQIERIIKAGIAAPSGKNLQPWRMDVITSQEARNKAGDIMEAGAKRLKEQGKPVGTNYNTSKIIRQAPVLIAFHNHEKENDPLSNLQSIGACIENMCLEAESMGLGTLWICDIECCMEEMEEFLGKKEYPLVAALAIGYSMEHPSARPRLSMEEVVRWDPV